MSQMLFQRLLSPGSACRQGPLRRWMSSTKEEWYARYKVEVAAGIAVTSLGAFGVVGYQYLQTRVELQEAKDALEKERELSEKGIANKRELRVVKDIAKESSKDLAKKYGLREAEVVAMRKTIEHQLKARKLAYDLVHSTPHD